MKFYLGHHNLRGYLQLDLCVALGSYMDSSLNVYAVFSFFCRRENLRFLQHKKKDYSDNYSGRSYKQGNRTVEELTNKLLGNS